MAWNDMAMGCASRRFAVPVAALLAALLEAAADRPENPAAAVAAAAGHPASRHLRAVATVVRDGETRTTTLETSGTVRLERVCAADICYGSWFDGRVRSTFGLNGTPLPEAEDADRNERTLSAILSTQFGEPEFVASGGRVRALAPDREGRLRFGVSAPDGSELVAVADARSDRLVGVDDPGGGSEQALVGTRSGSLVLYGMQAYDRITTIDGPLVPPAGPHAGVAEARELTPLSGSLPIVDCRVEGRPARCLLDSGTTPSAISLDFAEALEREPHGHIEIGGLGSYVTGVISAGPLALGGATFGQVRFAVIPRASRAPFDAILGSDVLAALRLVFDRGRNRIAVAASGPPPLRRAIALTFSAGVPYAQVRLAARAQSEAMLLDTGDSGTLSIGYDEYREDPTLFRARGSESAIGLAGPSMSALNGVLDHAEIDGEPDDALAISAVRGQHEGHVGYGFAARCAQFVLDLGQSRAECVAKHAATEH